MYQKNKISSIIYFEYVLTIKCSTNYKGKRIRNLLDFEYLLTIQMFDKLQGETYCKSIGLFQYFGGHILKFVLRFRNFILWLYVPNITNIKIPNRL